MSDGVAGISLRGVAVKYGNESFKKGRDGQEGTVGTGQEGSLAEGKGRSRRDRKGASWKGRDDRDVILMEGKGKEGKGRDGQEGSLMDAIRTRGRETVRDGRGKVLRSAK